MCSKFLKFEGSNTCRMRDMLSMASEYGGMMDMAGVAMIADSMLQDMSVT